MARPMTADQMLAAMKKWKVQVREYPGWRTRGRPASTGPFNDVRAVMIHHTGNDAGQSDAYLRFLFVDGRADLPAPLCHASTDMDGDLHLGAIGRANHAGQGSGAVLAKVSAENHPGFTAELHAGPDSTDGNAHFYGNEVRYDGGQPMTAKQYDSAVRWAAAICDFHKWSALSVIGHREWTTRKPDPGHCPMNKFRSDVAARLKAGPGGTSPTPVPPKGTPMASVLTTDEQAKLAKSGWLADQFGQGAQFEDQLDRIEASVAEIKALLVSGGDLNNQLDRIEADTDVPKV